MITHRLSNSKIYYVWKSMKARCYSNKSISFINYGNRNIIVCDEWKNNVNSFYKWAIQSGYKEGLSIERIDNNGNYEPSNCKWVTRAEQNRNMRSNIFITFNDKTMCRKDWANEIGITNNSLKKRINRWGIELALTTPVMKKYQNFRNQLTSQL